MPQRRSIARQPQSPPAVVPGLCRAQEVTLYGSSTCEDTALVRSRLVTLGVPFAEIDIDADASAAERVVALNGGARITPTLVAGDRPAIAEPTFRHLERWLRAAGYETAAPQATRISGQRAERPMPARLLPRADGGTASIERWRGTRQTVVFFGHDASCLACWGYAKQLARLRPALLEVETEPVVVAADAPTGAAAWLHELGPGTILLADGDGAWKRAVADQVGADRTGILLLVLDRYGAPRVESSAAEAGGLVDPGEAVEWARWLTLECPECGGELPWPE
jgi:mycoredoxin